MSHVFLVLLQWIMMWFVNFSPALQRLNPLVINHSLLKRTSMVRIFSHVVSQAKKKKNLLPQISLAGNMA